MKIDINRRKLLTALSLTVISVPIVHSELMPSILQASKTYNIESLKGLVPATTESQRFGRIYLEKRPEENSLSSLLMTLTKSKNLISSQIQQQIKAMQLEDLQQNRILFLDGWPFTVTEARLCALTLFF